MNPFQKSSSLMVWICLGIPIFAKAATVPSPPINMTGIMPVVSGVPVLIRWTKPLSDGGSPITGYTLRALNDTSAHCTVPDTVLSCSIPSGNPFPDSAYTVVAYAINTVGSSPASASLTFHTPSFTATHLAAVAGNGQVSVSWVGPNMPPQYPCGESKNYAVSSNPTSNGCTTSSTNCTITGLTNGITYTFTVLTTEFSIQSIGCAPVTSSSTPSAAVTPLASLAIVLPHSFQTGRTDYSLLPAQYFDLNGRLQKNSIRTYPSIPILPIK